MFICGGGGGEWWVACESGFAQRSHDSVHSRRSMNMTAPPLLRARGVTRRFGGLVAVNDVSLDVRQGEVVGIIGPNGAGKTTLFSLLSGFQKLDAGEILFDGASFRHASSPRRGAGFGAQLPDRAGFSRHDGLESSRRRPCSEIRCGAQFGAPRRCWIKWGSPARPMWCQPRCRFRTRSCLRLPSAAPPNRGSFCSTR